ncbi:MAG: glutamate racemase [Candidatus Omnitrophica bacterium]|nr:glutamate racemase [Candidatus Omnitrophota bacterium]
MPAARADHAESGRERPIGIFDSGIGGLTVLREIRRRLPAEPIVYFGDTARVPYGTKSKETITKFSIENVKFLQSFDVKMAVVACNTASSLSLETLKERFSMPVVGVIEPGARAAIACTRNGRVGVIGTKATIGSSAYEHCLKELRPSVKVYSQACPLFVPFVEEGWLEGGVVSEAARIYLEPLKTFGIDTLILGCTHYPLLSRVIQKIVGEHVRLVNSAEETAKEVRNRLPQSASIERPAGQAVRFYVSDEPEQFRTLGERFLGSPIHSVAKVADPFTEAALHV